jgi:hypothetical protein
MRLSAGIAKELTRADTVITITNNKCGGPMPRTLRIFIAIFFTTIFGQLLLAADSMAAEVYTCKLNLEANPQGGLYSGSLVNSAGAIVGTCVGSAPRVPIILAPAVGRPGGNTGDDDQPVRISNIIPTFCSPEESYVDCLQPVSLGTLHVEALRSVLGPVPPPRRRDDGAAMPSVEAVIARLVPWIEKTPVLRPYSSADDRRLLTQLITQKFQAAGLVDAEGRFSRDALNNSTRALGYLQRIGTVSPALASTLQSLSSRHAHPQEYRRVLERTPWIGKDRLAAAIVIDVVTASARYFPPRQFAGVAPGPGFWDAVGALLLFETGPGSIVGGYLMSAASCLCFNF